MRGLCVPGCPCGEARYSLCLIHMNAGWRYFVIDRAPGGDFLSEDGHATEAEARATIPDGSEPCTRRIRSAA